MSKVNRMEVSEFRQAGYLQELNRRFLHPLGLAMEVVIEDDGAVHFGGVWDYRDDPEGIVFADLDLAHAAAIEDEIERRRPEREMRLGYWIQPVGL